MPGKPFGSWEATVASPLSHKDQKPSDVTDDLRRLIRWLYTNNPFYVISAALVFVGLWTSFDASGSASAAKALGSSLAIYTLLLAITAVQAADPDMSLVPIAVGGLLPRLEGEFLTGR